MKRLAIILSGVAAASLLSACASGPKAPMQTDMTYTIQLDGFSVTWLKDNSGERTMPAAMFGTTQEIIDEIGEAIPASTSAFLVQDKDNNYLFDAGMGGNDSQLLAALDTLGLKPADIGYVFITHLHGDHIGGLTNAGSAVFPSAEVYLARTEHDAFANGPQASGVEGLASAYGERLHLFDYADELPGGFKAMHIPGHTPGHTAYGRANLLLVGDIMHGVALQTVHPELNARFDQDSTVSVASRRMILDLAPDFILAGSHFPEPGFICPAEQ